MSKHIDRLDAIREIVNQAGKLDAESIKIRLCEKLGIDLDEIKKSTFYRNLSECVDMGWIKEDVEGEKKVWSCINDQSHILGEALLESSGGLIFVPSLDSIKNYIAISKGNKKIDFEREKVIYFQISNQFLCLRINKDILPIKLHISRKSQDSNDIQFTKIQDEFGVRTISIMVPVSKVSSYKGGRTGHCIIELSDSEIFNIEDLESTNTTSFCVIDDSLSDDLILHGNAIGTKTTNSNWVSSIESKLDLKVINSSIISSGNCVIFCSDDFKLYIKK